ncbi:hypothetical protein HDU76_004575 [Blyttiomyces sp. JEL0837]|nr:hypothetical protein HDU76_004575 [Blyttiomyces sp. JEL0837]
MPASAPPQLDEHGNKIKRPPNAFILFRTDIQPSLRKEFPGKNSKDLSSIVTDRWQTAPKEVKEYYTALSERNREQHKIKYPDYKYSNKAKKTFAEPGRKRTSSVKTLSEAVAEAASASAEPSTSSSPPTVTSFSSIETLVDHATAATKSKTTTTRPSSALLRALSSPATTTASSSDRLYNRVVSAAAASIKKKRASLNAQLKSKSRAGSATDDGDDGDGEYVPSSLRRKSKSTQVRRLASSTSSNKTSSIALDLSSQRPASPATTVDLVSSPVDNVLLLSTEAENILDNLDQYNFDFDIDNIEYSNHGSTFMTRQPSISGSILSNATGNTASTGTATTFTTADHGYSSACEDVDGEPDSEVVDEINAALCHVNLQIPVRGNSVGGNAGNVGFDGTGVSVVQGLSGLQFQLQHVPIRAKEGKVTSVDEEEEDEGAIRDVSEILELAGCNGNTNTNTNIVATTNNNDSDTKLQAFLSGIVFQNQQSSGVTNYNQEELLSLFDSSDSESNTAYKSEIENANHFLLKGEYDSDMDTKITAINTIPQINIINTDTTNIPDSPTTATQKALALRSRHQTASQSQTNTINNATLNLNIGCITTGNGTSAIVVSPTRRSPRSPLSPIRSPMDLTSPVFVLNDGTISPRFFGKIWNDESSDGGSNGGGSGSGIPMPMLSSNGRRASIEMAPHFLQQHLQQHLQIVAGANAMTGSMGLPMGMVPIPMAMSGFMFSSADEVRALEDIGESLGDVWNSGHMHGNGLGMGMGTGMNLGMGMGMSKIVELDEDDSNVIDLTKDEDQTSSSNITLTNHNNNNLGYPFHTPSPTPTPPSPEPSQSTLSSPSDSPKLSSRRKPKFTIPALDTQKASSAIRPGGRRSAFWGSLPSASILFTPSDNDVQMLNSAVSIAGDNTATPMCITPRAHGWSSFFGNSSNSNKSVTVTTTTTTTTTTTNGSGAARSSTTTTHMGLGAIFGGALGNLLSPTRERGDHGNGNGSNNGTFFTMSPRNPASPRNGNGVFSFFKS